ncbi:hypothetical protein PV783_28250 [Chitinophaga sp. CC14]
MLESKGTLSGKDLKVYKDLIALREKIKAKNYKVNWVGFLPVIAHFLEKIREHFMDQ